MRGLVLALAGGADWIPAMAGSLHPPYRRKKLRPLRPRLAARTALCSVPSSSPHAAGRAGAPVFLARRKRDCARRRVSEANRREAAALRPETNGPCTVQKRKGSIAPAGGRKTGARWACLRFYACFQLTAWCGGALVVNAWTVRSSSLPLTWLWIVGPDSLVRPFPQGLPFSQ